MARLVLPLAIIALHIVSLQTFCAGQQQQLWPFYDKRTVYITNNVPNPALKVHCRSKGNDLLIHSINTTQLYSFEFKPSLFKTDQYACHFYWHVHIKSVDVWNKKVDDACKDSKGNFNCYYRVQPEGFYFGNDNVNYKKIDDWGAPAKNATASTSGQNH